MTSNAPTILIDNRDGLRALTATIAEQPWVAIDTEFHAERRYHPELFLLQFAFASGASFIVDPQRVDIAVLGPVLSHASCVVHAGQQDLAILWRECEAAPATVFDVQIAAGMLGHGYPTRLETLVESILDTPLPKSTTLSDWSTRPLTRKQLAYAISDAQVLVPLRSALMNALESHGRTRWALDASAELAAAAQRRAPIDDRWTRWEIASQLDTEAVAAMANLCAWRDQRGRDKNQPATFMLSDGLALDIARRRPTSIDELASNRRIPQGLIRRFGREILSVVQAARVDPPAPPFIPTMTQLATMRSMEIWALAEGQRTGVAPNLLLPSEMLTQLIRDGLNALEGWRADAMGDSLAAFMAGQSAIRMTPDGPVVT